MISKETQVELLRTMIRIRAFEERVRDLFAAGPTGRCPAGVGTGEMVR